MGALCYYMPLMGGDSDFLMKRSLKSFGDLK